MTSMISKKPEDLKTNKITISAKYELFCVSVLVL